MTFPAKLASFFLILLVGLSCFVPFFFSQNPNAFDPYRLSEAEPPSLKHWFGTDDLGRDQLIRCLYGARVSLLVALVSMSIALTLGVFVGVSAGFFAGWIDELLMRFVDVMMGIPTLFLILIVQVSLSPSITNVMIVIGCTGWMGIARLIRAEVLSVKQRPFVYAAKARGVSQMRLVVRYVLPHCMSPVIVAAFLGVGNAILTESVLSFLGLGVQPPQASWGNMLDNSLSFMTTAPWLALYPGLMIGLTVLSIQYLGDVLRSKLNVRE